MKLLIYSSILFFTFNVNAETCVYSLKEGTQKLNWTGFKYTKKAAVGGTFKDITFTQKKDATSITQLLESVSFKINTNSIDSGNATRDSTLKKTILGFLKVPEQITGEVVTATDLSMSLDLIMNEKTPLTMALDAKDGKIKAAGSLDLLSHGLKKSYDSVHLACKGLHTGEDGLSKTWSTVDLKIEADYDVKCSKGFIDSIKSWFS